MNAIDRINKHTVVMLHPITASGRSGMGLKQPTRDIFKAKHSSATKARHGKAQCVLVKIHNINPIRLDREWRKPCPWFLHVAAKAILTGVIRKAHWLGNTEQACILLVKELDFPILPGYFYCPHGTG